MTRDTYTATVWGQRFRLGSLTAEQLTTLRALLQAATFHPSDSPVTEANRWITVEGAAAGPVIVLDRRAILEGVR
jgi:hypothetical protein